jgi:quercetin 2,3-dioxygenase
MKKYEHKSIERGHINHGWLDTYHSFSFANYYNPQKMGFGLLRVLNDDIIKSGEGFGTHGHDNMEIITIVLDGALEHKDSMGNIQVMHPNEVQVMSAGSGITHSEYNHSKSNDVNLLQIWIFPKVQDVEPRYDQKIFQKEDRKNKIQNLVSPDQKNQGLWIHQDSWLSRIDLEKGNSFKYDLNKEGNGVFIFLIDGKIEVEGEKLGKRDALGLSDTKSVKISSSENSEILIIEVPTE